MDSGVSYEDRVARRKEEIESLQQAASSASFNRIANPSTRDTIFQ